MRRFGAHGRLRSRSEWISKANSTLSNTGLYSHHGPPNIHLCLVWDRQTEAFEPPWKTGRQKSVNSGLYLSECGGVKEGQPLVLSSRNVRSLSGVYVCVEGGGVNNGTMAELHFEAHVARSMLLGKLSVNQWLWNYAKLFAEKNERMTNWNGD